MGLRCAFTNGITLRKEKILFASLAAFLFHFILGWSSRLCSQSRATTRASSSIPFKEKLANLAPFLSSYISSETGSSSCFVTHANTLTNTRQQLTPFFVRTTCMYTDLITTIVITATCRFVDKVLSFSSFSQKTK
jgi:hypothetical protein